MTCQTFLASKKPEDATSAAQFGTGWPAHIDFIHSASADEIKELNEETEQLVNAMTQFPVIDIEGDQVEDLLELPLQAGANSNYLVQMWEPVGFRRGELYQNCPGPERIMAAHGVHGTHWVYRMRTRGRHTVAGPSMEATLERLSVAANSPWALDQPPERIYLGRSGLSNHIRSPIFRMGTSLGYGLRWSRSLVGYRRKGKPERHGSQRSRVS